MNAFFRNLDWRAARSFVRRHYTVFAAVVILGAAIAVGVKIWPEPPLKTFDKLEAEAGKYGMIVAGAPRIAPYEGHLANDLRCRFLSLVRQLLEENSDDELQTLSVELQSSNLAVAVEMMMSESAPDTIRVRNKQLALDLLQSALEDFRARDLAASRIDRARLRLGHMRYLISQIEDLTLEESHPLSDGFRRLYLTLELTAFVRPEHAGGVIVYFDLYPKDGDRWAHRLGKLIEDTFPDKGAKEPNHRLRQKKIRARLRQKVPNEYTSFEGDSMTEWESQKEKLRRAAFRSWAVLEDSLTLREEVLDPYATAHRYLQRWMPRVVHVDPLDEGELILDMKSGESMSSISARGGASKGKLKVGGGFATSSHTGKTSASADVNTLSLAFAAGNSRAGWIFLPSTASLRDNAMKPTERRIRIVVDVPRELEDMSVHVHKQFLDRDLRPIRETAFARQIEAENKARIVLSEVEDWFPTHSYEGDSEDAGARDFRSGTNWTLVKSRMRNTIVQAWSEALSIRIPEEKQPWSTPWLGEPRPLAIRATVVQDNGAEEGWVLVNGKEIEAVGVRESLLPKNAVRIEYDGFLYPGLVDAHNHPHFAAIPRWAPERRFESRYMWWRDPEYEVEVMEPYRRMKSAGKRYLSLKYGEIRAVMGGATSVQGTFSPPEAGVLIRNLNEAQGVWAYTDSIGGLPDAEVAKQLRRVRSGEVKRLVFHIAEGTDAQSRNEFETLRYKGLLLPETVIIHGIALNERQLTEVARAGASLVWSPSSNLALYDSTLNVEAALELGINVALAPDWTVTGSDNMLSELHEAWYYVQKRNLANLIDPKTLYRMVTTAAAQAMGCEKLGRVKAGYLADVFLAPAYHEDAYENLLVLSPRDIDLVLVEGNPVYGIRQYVLAAGLRSEECDRIEDIKPRKVVVTTGDQRYVPRAGQRYVEIRAALADILGAGGVARLIENPDSSLRH